MSWVLTCGRQDVRNIRKKLMQELGRLQRDGDLSSDEQHRIADNVQSVTDKYMRETDALLKSVQDS